MEGAIPLNFVHQNEGVIGYVAFTVEHFEDETGKACIGIRYGVHKCSWKDSNGYKRAQQCRRVMLRGARYQATDALLNNIRESGAMMKYGGDRVDRDFRDMLSNTIDCDRNTVPTSNRSAGKASGSTVTTNSHGGHRQSRTKDTRSVDEHIWNQMNDLYKYCENNAPQKHIHVELLDLMQRHFPQHLDSRGAPKSYRGHQSTAPERRRQVSKNGF